jgi:dTDP-4-amino-4,6-dideoxygalactose transaminase
VIDRLAATWHLATGAFTPYLRPLWDREDRALVSRFLAGDDLAGEVEAFEAACRVGGLHAAVVDSGRSAIRLALMAGGLRAGDEVALPSYACYGVIAPVVAANLAPVLVDVDETLNISLDAVMAAASNRLRAVILPHLGGVVGADAGAIAGWARAHGVLVIEDAAQAFGHPDAGRVGDLVVYSTGVGKPLFGPGGGWVSTRDARFAEVLEARTWLAPDRAVAAERVRAFLDHFGDRLVTRGWTVIRDAMAARTRSSVVDPETPAPPPTRPTGLEAALARRQMARIDEIVAGQRRWLTFWRDRLTHAGLPALRVPPASSIGLKVWASFDGPDAAGEAGRLKRALRAAGVEIESAYTPLHLRPPFATARRGPLATTERLWRHVFMLPSRPNLGDADRARFERAIAAVARHAPARPPR